MRPVVIANQHRRLRFNRREVVRMVHTLDAHHDVLGLKHSGLGNSGELSLVFMTDPALAQLHSDFLGDPTPTDVITFAGDPASGTAGEICVSVDTALSYAREHRHEFTKELTLYLVHGWLHLAGYDDLVPAKKRVMRRAEARAMALLSREHCLPTFRIAR